MANQEKFFSCFEWDILYSPKSHQDQFDYFHLILSVFL